MLNEQPPPVEGEEIAELQDSQPNWLSIAEEAYETSTSYIDANYRKQWEKNISNFNSKHPPGSKYHSDAYKFRTRLFRPKTRSAIRRAEATFASAMFATSDVITVDPVDQSDSEEDRRAEVWQALLNHRLKYSIPWFLVACGAFQESKVYGVVVSRQDWEYEEREESFFETDPITQAEVERSRVKVIADKPRCEPIEIENIRFDPGAKWYDPVNTSPYFIELIPMYVGDVLDMMQRRDPKTGQPEWKEYNRGEILTYGQAKSISDDSTRQARTGNKTDPKGQEHKSREFEIVWVHRNFVRKDGHDFEFYTLSTRAMLTDPAPSSSILGRPYRVGITSIETHRAVPAGDVEMGEGLQAEANDTCNQRIDNVKLVLNRGKYVQRLKNVDLMTLKRSYPGRIVMTDDVNAIKEDTVQDVTGSSYQEQDRINADMDDLLGGFGSGSVMSNRKLNETVGGMSMINQAGSAVSEYSVRTFVETWVEPVLSDLIKLIQHYESDENIQKFAKSVGVDISTREELTQDLTATASVGFGTLDPKARSQAVSQTIQALATAVPWAMQGLDAKRLSKELFGPLGYRDGSKFFPNLGDGPPQQPQDPMIELKKQEIQMRSQVEMARIKMDYELKMNEIALKESLTREQLYSRLDLDTDKHNLSIMQEMTRREDIKSKREEMALKATMGEGI